jgi:Lysophospholipase
MKEYSDFCSEDLSVTCTRNARAVRIELAAVVGLLVLAIANLAVVAPSGGTEVLSKSEDTKTGTSLTELAGLTSDCRAKRIRAPDQRMSVGHTMLVLNTPGKSVKGSASSRNYRAKGPKPIRLKIEVPCRAWLPNNVQPKALLLCVHGLGLNSDAFNEFGQQMKNEGIGVFAVDVRGFGTWMRLKGKTECDFKSCISDVVKALKVLHSAYPEKPIFVLGESMGGAIAMRVAAEHPDLIDGLVSSVPTGDRFHKTKYQLKVALQLVTLRGGKQIDVGTRVIEQATDDPALQTIWKDDPLNRLKLSSKELLHFQRFMNENHETAKRIDKTPVLFLVGLSDKLAKPEGTIELFNEVTAADKKLVTIRSAEHLIFEHSKLSPELKVVVVNWLLTRSNKPVVKLPESPEALQRKL